MPHGIVTQAKPTSAQTQNFTVSGMGTPLGMLGFMNFVLTPNTDVVDMGIAIGAAEAGASPGVGIVATAEDNQATSDAANIQDIDIFLRISDAGTNSLTESAESNDTITDGFQLDWLTAVTAYQVSLLMFTEGIANFDVRYQDYNGTGTTVVTPGFQPDVVIFYGSGGQNEFSNGNGQMLFGFYERTGDNHVSIGINVNNADTTPSCAQRIDDAALLGNVNITNGSPFNHFTLGSFTGTGFTATKVSSSATMEIPTISIELSAGYAAAVGTFVAPTSTGIVEVISGLGFTPQMLMLIGVDRTAAGGDADSCGFMIGAVTANGDQFCVGGWSTDHDTTTNSDAGSSHRTDNCLYQDNDAGVAESVASFDSFGDGTVDLNFSTATQATIIGYLAIGISATPIVIPVPVGPLY